MVEKVLFAAPSTPIWVLVVDVLSLLVFLAAVGGGLFAAWKVFQWLRKWKP